jgi:hypothetical protein
MPRNKQDEQKSLGFFSRIKQFFTGPPKAITPPISVRPQGNEYGTAVKTSPGKPKVASEYSGPNPNAQYAPLPPGKVKPGEYADIPPNQTPNNETKYTGMPTAAEDSNASVKPPVPPSNYNATAKANDPQPANANDHYKKTAAPPVKPAYQQVDITRLTEAQVDSAFDSKAGFPFAFTNFEQALKSQDPKQLAAKLMGEKYNLVNTQPYAMHTADIYIDKTGNLHVSVVLKDKDGQKVYVEADFDLQNKQKLESLVNFVNTHAANSKPTVTKDQAATNTAALKTAGDNYGSSQVAPNPAQKVTPTNYGSMPNTNAVPKANEYGSVPNGVPKANEYGSVPNASQNQVSRLAALIEAKLQEQPSVAKASTTSIPNTQFDAGSTPTADKNSPPPKPDKLPPTLFAKYQTKPAGNEGSATKGASTPGVSEPAAERNTKLR